MNVVVPERKILILGSNAVGKTTTFKSITGEMIDVSYRPSLSVNIGYKYFELNGKEMGLRIWDLGGQLLHRSVWKNYYKNTDGVILMYDITRKRTFNEIQIWKKDMRQFMKSKVLAILVGNKCDLESERVISIEDGELLRKKMKAFAFFETSALRNVNIHEVFNVIVSKLM